MSILSELVNLLVPYVKDAVPIAEYEIQEFAKERNILLPKPNREPTTTMNTIASLSKSIFDGYGNVELVGIAYFKQWLSKLSACDYFDLLQQRAGIDR